MQYRVGFCSELPGFVEELLHLLPEKHNAEYYQRYRDQYKEKQYAQITDNEHDCHGNEDQPLLEYIRHNVYEEHLYSGDVLRNATHKLTRRTFGYLFDR